MARLQDRSGAPSACPEINLIMYEPVEPSFFDRQSKWPCVSWTRDWDNTVRNWRYLP